MAKAVVFTYPVPLIAIVLLFSNVFCEPPVSSGGWGQQQQQQQYSGGYSQQSGSYSSGYGSPAGLQSSGGWGQQQQPQPLQSSGGGGGWGQQQQPQVQSNNGGWGQQSQQQQSGGGWGSSSSNQNQVKGQGNSGWGSQLNLELDTANLNMKNLNPAKIFRSIIGIPRKIANFIRESGLYLLFIPLIIILPLMLLAFNFGRTFAHLSKGWGWSRSLSTVESGIVGYLKSPVWQKIGETLMDEKVFERIMKSLEEFNKDW